MSVIGSNALAGASGAGGGAAAGYTIERALRFNSADTSYLNRTTTSAGNRRTWTWSGWLKRTNPGRQGVFFQASAPTVNSLYFNASDTLLWLVGGSSVHLQTNRLFRDTSAWMHVVLAVDSTQATQFDRIKLYINGVKLESADYTTSPITPLNYDYSVNAASSDHRLGGLTYGYSDCYLAEVYLIDGQQLEASDFGEYDDNNVWQPKAFTGSYKSFDNSQTWSSNITTTGNSGTFHSSYPATNAFNNNDANYAHGNADGSQSAVVTLTLSPGVSCNNTVTFLGGMTSPGTATISVNGGTAVNLTSGSSATTKTNVSFSGTVTSIVITKTSSDGSGMLIYGFEIDGKRLVDSGVSISSNSFHLDFSDNTSTTTIGEDSSGNNNDFTANNLTVFNTQSLPGISLDNNDDRLLVPASTDMEIETGDFTIEAFVNAKDKTGLNGVISRRRYGVTEGWFMNITNGVLSFYGSIDGVWYSWLTGSTNMNTDQWYHVAITREGNLVRLFVNGVLDGSKTITSGINAAIATAQVAIGDISYNQQQGAFYGYISNVRIVKGTALYTSNFTVPSTPLTNVTNTTLLCCQSDTSATAAAVSPGTLTVNGNTFAGEFSDNSPDLDSLIDTPTNYTASSGNNGGNYCILNPLDISGTSTISDGGLEASIAGGATNTISGNFHVTSGKWYWEASITSTAVTCMIGVADGSQPPAERQWQSEGWYYYASNGNKYHDGGAAAYGSSYGQNDIIGVALDMDAGTLSFYKNGVSQGVAYNTGLSGLPIVPTVNNGGGSSTHTVVFNFGQRPFVYTPPSNHLSICTQNLSDPTVADGSTAMDATLYVGNATARSITGLDFAPDLVWIKNRSQGDYHLLTDTVRGATKQLTSALTNAETTNTQGLTAFNSDGFDIGTHVFYNTNNENYVAWSWDGGTSTVTNTDGTHSAQVRANSSTGFSISTHSRTTAASISTWGHGLGAAPEFAILKAYNGSYNWIVWHKSMGNRMRIFLNSNSAGNSYGFDVWSSDSTTLGVYGTIITGGGTALDCVTYAWTPVEGYSRFGSYEGNGIANGQFVFTGFTPKLVMIKDIDSASNWNVYDTSRDPDNIAGRRIYWNLNNAESTFTTMDILSNGFKIRTNNADANENTRTFIWAAWAEHPFKTARAR